MVALIQGWKPDSWQFSGRKTAVYRQIGNAFPPPVAEAVGRSIRRALEHDGIPVQRIAIEHDPIYKALRTANTFLTHTQIERVIGTQLDIPELERRISLLSRDFHVDVRNGTSPVAYRLGAFKAFLGQEDHLRHDLFSINRSKIS
jgi:DNA (cytosine-5)-methyltransferase 1